MSLSYVTLVLNLYDAAGNPIVRGAATLAPNQRLTDVPDQMLITQSAPPAVFRSGSFPQPRLLTTDSAGPQPSGWKWTITFTGVPGNPPGFSFYLLSTGGATQYLSSLAPVPGSLPAAITNLDGGSAVTGMAPAGSFDGGGA